MDNAPEIHTYAEFWPYYLAQHGRKGTKVLHAVGSLLGLTIGISGGFTGRWLWIPIGLIVGYSFAWFAHFVVEKNLPATFGHPFWSFYSDFRMAALLLTGRL